ncbi:MAG: oligosaccharide flippase family protein [Anaerolineae bacterium]|nr:oligosaccharide flippase family protein [Anaerolineae bacterium]
MDNNLNLRRFASDSLINFIQIILTVLLGFGISSIVGRTLGTTGKGIYEVAMLLPIMLQWIFNLGITTASTYYVAHGDHDLALATRGNITLSLWISLFGMLVGFLVVYFGSADVFPGVPRPILLLSLAVLPFLYFRGNLNAILQGLQDFRAFSIVELIPSLITFFLLIVFMLTQSVQVADIVLAYLLGNATAVIAVIMILRKRSGTSLPLFSLRIDPTYLKQMMNYGLKSQLNVISIYLLLRVDVLLINLLGGGAASVGIYSIAVLFADRVWLVSGFTSRIILPRIAASESADANRTELTLMITRYTFWFSLVIAIGLALLGEWVIVLIYGEPFRPAIHALLGILPGVILFNFGVMLGSDIAGRGRPDITATQAGIAFIINLVVNLILIPKYDYVGAALASTLAYAYYGIAHIYIFSRMNGTPWWNVWLPTQKDIIYASKLLVMARKRLKI